MQIGAGDPIKFLSVAKCDVASGVVAAGDAASSNNTTVVNDRDDGFDANASTDLEFNVVRVVFQGQNTDDLGEATTRIASAHVRRGTPRRRFPFTQLDASAPIFNLKAMESWYGITLTVEQQHNVRSFLQHMWSTARSDHAHSNIEYGNAMFVFSQERLWLRERQGARIPNYLQTFNEHYRAGRFAMDARHWATDRELNQIAGYLQCGDTQTCARCYSHGQCYLCLQMGTCTFARCNRRRARCMHCGLYRAVIVDSGASSSVTSGCVGSLDGNHGWEVIDVVSGRLFGPTYEHEGQTYDAPSDFVARFDREFMVINSFQSLIHRTRQNVIELLDELAELEMDGIPVDTSSDNAAPHFYNLHGKLEAADILDKYVGRLTAEHETRSSRLKAYVHERTRELVLDLVGASTFTAEFRQLLAQYASGQ